VTPTRAQTQLARTSGPAPQKRPPLPVLLAPDDPAPPPEVMGRIAETVLGEGNLERLDATQRVHFLVEVCRALGLNPLTRPFEILKLQGGKTVLYLRKEGTEQLAQLRGISTELLSESEVNGSWRVRMRASIGPRFADATGSVAIETAAGQKLRGEAFDNATKKAETQARRRAVLGLCGLTWLERGGSEPEDTTEVFTDRHGNRTAVPPQRPAPRIPLEQGREIFFGDQGDAPAEQPEAQAPAAAATAPAEEQVPDKLDATLAEFAGQPEVAPKEPSGQARLIDGEEVGPPGPLWADVLALVPKLDAAGITYILPRQDQPEDVHRGWIATKTTALRAKTGPHR